MHGIVSTLKIVFLCTSSLDNPSPRGRWLPLARELVRHGHAVHLLLLHPTFDRLSERSFRADGAQVMYVSQMHVYGLPGQRRYFNAIELMDVSLRASFALAVHALRLRPDAIHVCKPQPINGLAGLIASRRGARLYVDCDDYEADANRFGGRWQLWMVRWWEDALPPRACGVSVNTRFLYQRCTALGVLPERLIYVPNSISAHQCQRPDEEAICNVRRALGLVGHPTVIYVGTLSNVAHGTGLLLDAFALVLRQMPRARLLMVGDGDDRAALQSQAEQLGIAHAVCWRGHVPFEQIPVYLSTADCSVDPVYDSPAARARSPMKIVESLGLGVPVVTGDVGDRREMLANGNAGLLVAPGDAQALAAGIAQILQDLTLRGQLAKAARERATAYCWTRLAHTWQALYDL